MLRGQKRNKPCGKDTFGDNVYCRNHKVDIEQEQKKIQEITQHERPVDICVANGELVKNNSDISDEFVIAVLLSIY